MKKVAKYGSLCNKKTKSNIHFIEIFIKSQKRLIASQLKQRKGKDIKWILIENINSILRELFL